MNRDSIENIRRVGVYIGPAILASIAANVAYDLAFGATIGTGRSSPLFICVIFAAFGVLIAWQMLEPFGRVAWSLFALHYGLQALTAVSEARISPVWNLSLLTAFSVLATCSGARGASQRDAIMASTLFVVVAVSAFAGRYYGEVLLGTHSVIR